MYFLTVRWYIKYNIIRVDFLTKFNYCNSMRFTEADHVSLLISFIILNLYNAVVIGQILKKAWPKTYQRYILISTCIYKLKCRWFIQLTPMYAMDVHVYICLLFIYASVLPGEPVLDNSTTLYWILNIFLYFFLLQWRTINIFNLYQY